MTELLPIGENPAGSTVVINHRVREGNHPDYERWLDEVPGTYRTALIDKVQPLLVSGDDFYLKSGLDFWFTPSEARAALPVRWKRFLISWSAIYPLVLGASLATGPVLDLLHIPQNRLIVPLAVTGLVVLLMVYVVMPRYTRLVHRWLFR